MVRGHNERVATPANRERVLTEVERLREALLAWDAGMPIDVEAVARSARDLETERNAAVAAGGQRAQDELAKLAELGYVSGWDQYVRDLRERVLELRAQADAGAESTE